MYLPKSARECRRTIAHVWRLVSLLSSSLHALDWKDRCIRGHNIAARTEHGVFHVQVVNELRKITQDELVEFYCANVAPGSKQRRQLTVHVCSHNHSGAEDKKTPGTSAAHHDKRMVEVQDIARTKQALHLIEPPTPGKLQVVDTT